MSGFNADIVLQGQFGGANLSGTGASHSVDGDVKPRELFNFASGIEPAPTVTPEIGFKIPEV